MKTTTRFMIAAQALMRGAGMVFLDSCGKNTRETRDSDSISDTAVVAPDSVTKGDATSSVTKFYIEKNGDITDENSRLWVNVDGKKIN